VHLHQHKPDWRLVDQRRMVPVPGHLVAPVLFLLFRGCDGGVTADVVRIRELRSGVMHASVPIGLPLPVLRKLNWESS